MWIYLSGKCMENVDEFQKNQGTCTGLSITSLDCKLNESQTSGWRAQWPMGHALQSHVFLQFLLILPRLALYFPSRQSHFNSKLNYDAEWGYVRASPNMRGIAGPLAIQILLSVPPST